MKLFVCIIAAFVASTLGEERRGTANPQEKRELPFAADKQSAPSASTYATAAPALLKVGPQSFAGPKTAPVQAVSYTPQSFAAPQAQYSYIPQNYKFATAPAHFTFGFAPQAAQQLEYSAQPVAYASQPLTYSAKVAPEKTAPAPEHAAPITFSPASEVSSFKFSSPLVTYSNLGVLNQITGKLATAAANSPQPAQTVAAQVAYATAAPSQKSAPQQLTYSPAPQYAALPQKFSYAPAPPQTVAYAPAPQKYYFAAAAPSTAPVSSPAATHRIVYVPASPQYYTAAPQQVAYSPPQYRVVQQQPQQYSTVPQQVSYSAAPSQHQQQYAYAVAAPAPASASQAADSAPQAAYSLPPQYQYTAAVPASKYDNTPSNDYSQ